MYKCNICHSTYSHPGNFKQHLLKHEREKRGLSGDSNHLNSVLQSAFGKIKQNYNSANIFILHSVSSIYIIHCVDLTEPL